MHTIRISAETMKRLESWAEPLEDTAESALVKALDAADRDRLRATCAVPKPSGPVRRRKGGNSRPKLPQKAFRRPLLETIHAMGGSARIGAVHSLMKERMMPHLLPGDLEPVSTGDERWWNATCWERNDLVKEGYLRADSPRAIRELSVKGTELAETWAVETPETFVDHLFAIPEMGVDADFEDPFEEAG